MKSGFVVLVGRSNVGKSTLLNTLVGTKIAIVTNKPQTTRQAIQGVLHDARGQAVFVDTPGVLKESRSAITGKLLQAVKNALTDIEVILYVVDPTREIGEEERYTLSLIRHIEKPKILVINKIDAPRKLFLEDYRALAPDFDAVHELSALRASHIEPLKDRVFELLPEGEALYPPEQWTNVNSKFWVAEIIREKIFNTTEKEVPYSCAVEVDEIEEKPEMFVITARILVGDERYKKIVIGKGASKLKEIGSTARRELEAALNKKVFLDLQVETDEHWERML
ncbi:MAG: GTPase Era [Candidatus Magasanikbacteria bacterium]|nr:GTPase Era [Candidatus Magasanikbacteria bacterium]